MPDLRVIYLNEYRCTGELANGNMQGKFRCRVERSTLTNLEERQIV